MEVIPVLDVLGGVAVHARGGKRAEYRPVRSVLADGADPIVLARAYRDCLGARSCYVADLDAIAGAPPSLELARAIADLGLRPWVDAGIRDAATARALLDAGATRVILGLETLPSVDVLDRLTGAIGTESLVFSLDVKGEMPVAASPELAALDALDLAAHAYELGSRNLLVLDLDRVGADEGPPLSLAASVQERWANAHVAIGGGVRDGADLERCADAGLAAALVASALHAGRIARDHIHR